jgi:hypothetical protein
MSTRELIQQVKALPARERQKFVLAGLMLEDEKEAPVSLKLSNRRVKWPDVEMRAKRIFGGRVLPNPAVR